MKNIVLPLGISFFTFQQISFIVDSYKSNGVRYKFLEYALFVSFFPQLIAGPIVVHQEMIPQFGDIEKKKIHYGNLKAGLEYFILGFAKKVLVADYFAQICDAGYENLLVLNTYSAILTILAFTLQIYFDFSGYCDMAKGLGKMFNIEIAINFDSPYKSLTIVEFWKRWHMTLTRFLTQYLYIPLGGNRRGKWRTYINIMIVFSLSGLWHGANWTFVIWGMLHGGMQIICRLGKSIIVRITKGIQWLMTFVLINFAWVFFRADSLGQSMELLSKLLYGGNGLCQESLVAAACNSSIMFTVVEKLVRLEWITIIQQIWMVIVFAGGIVLCSLMPSSHEIVLKDRSDKKYYIYLGLLFAWSFVCLSQVSKFIYFNF